MPIEYQELWRCHLLLTGHIKDKIIPASQTYSYNAGLQIVALGEFLHQTA